MPVKEIKGTLNRVLEIDLSLKTFSIIPISNQLRQMYLGGKGLGLKLLYDRLKPGIDPLGEDNLIIIMTGVLAGTSAPCSGRFHAVFKSPLTNIIGSSSCGGSFGRQLKSNGWDGIILRGRSDKPVTLRIHNDKVDFLDAATLWGKDILETQAIIGTEKQEALVIGPAGENLVRFANAASGQRYFGRGGLGAVMGSKNLKAVVALNGQYKVVPFFNDRFQKIKTKANKYINQNHMSLLMRQFGTAANAGPIIKNRMLPVNNFTCGNHPEAINITGQKIKENHKTSYHTCTPCSIFCGHKGLFNDKQVNVPEYETLALLGSNLGIFDPNDISRFNEICNQKGMDTISAGGTLAWVMEATRKGLVKTDLEFGSPERIVKALENIANLEDFGKQMAMGSRTLSNKFGGKGFAIQVKGLEMAGYDPRGAYGQGLGYAVANRGACHLSSFPVGFENLLGFLAPDTIRSKHRFVKFFENFYAAVNSLDICQFTGYGLTLEALLSRMTPHFVLRFLMQNIPVLAISLVDFSIYPEFFSTVSGIDLSSKQFLMAGERIHILERLMNTNEGIRKVHDTLPERFLLEAQKDDPEKRRVPLEPMLKKYYKLRGYDEDGIPNQILLKKLGI
ncbi:MAG: aldehyde ferredoxin oxidoreductase family protein [Deltaproteobacteria bacterium]|uniref:aldehyde ferredoxin oxidoreductase family protein n=1 Tax=Desulfobacula sp. TaxID=2593537 RepID=UPI001991E1E7|nr:aldehyde ferredoxin oxidoreductase family protein [Candidatus Desulfobacula maris]MBL6994563.1 aldehyde ferredoxin oxidoreductase family protein [Desulfobacula sp.]